MSDLYAQMKNRIVELEAELTALREELKETEEKCQFWCDEARKLGYKEK